MITPFTVITLVQLAIRRLAESPCLLVIPRLWTFAFSVSTVVVSAVVAATAASVGIGIPTPPIVERPRAPASVIAVVIVVVSGKSAASEFPLTEG